MIAVLGLGLMGTGMARRLLGAGFPVAVYNRTRSKAEALAADGARVADSPRDAATGADVVISMLADDVASRATWLGNEGALAALEPGALIIESGTVSPEWISELAAVAAKKSIDVLDAPVTGSKSHAAAGELNFLVGGLAATLEKARPVFAAMGKNVVHVGPSGSGATLKLINNFVCGVQAASLAEAMVWIERSGIDRDMAIQILGNGAPGSPLVKTVSARMAHRDYTPNFHLELMRKDLDYSIGEAARNGVELTSAHMALAAFDRAIEEGHGHEDFSSVVEPIRLSSRA
jgi:3-hydroxyisobutyrate dehydrogenase